MIKRRSFLAMLGLAPMAAVTKAVPEPLAAPVAPAIETAAEGVVMANVRMPVRVSLTAEQVQIAESWGMPVWEYAKHLMALKREGKIEAPVKLSADVEQAPLPDYMRDPNWPGWNTTPETRKEAVITHNMGDKPSYMKESDPNVWSNL